MAPQDGPRAFKLSLNDFIIKALAMALQTVPAANATWTERGLLRHRASDIAVAVALEGGGLHTPVIRDAEIKSLSEISNEMRDLAARARSKRLAPHEYQGGSTTISNLGMYGIDRFDAVINPPQASILAVGRAEKRPVVKDDALKIATMMSVTLSVDHRVIDGALGAELLAAFKAYHRRPRDHAGVGSRSHGAKGDLQTCDTRPTHRRWPCWSTSPARACRPICGARLKAPGQSVLEFGRERARARRGRLLLAATPSSPRSTARSPPASSATASTIPTISAEPRRDAGDRAAAGAARGKAPGSWYVNVLATFPEFRRRGIGAPAARHRRREGAGGGRAVVERHRRELERERGAALHKRRLCRPCQRACDPVSRMSRMRATGC